MLSKYGNCTCLLKIIKIQAENQLFSQIQLRRILDILRAFLIKQLLIPLALVGYEIISKIQLVVYYQCCILIGWATTRLYVIAH